MTGFPSKKKSAQAKLTVNRAQLEQWVEALKDIDALHHPAEPESIDAQKVIADMGQALAQPKQEPVMILPDGSAFGVMSFPLPDDHWLYAPNEYRDGEYEPIDLPKPILTHALRDAVVAAVRYAVRGATMRGQETDFDPDALVQNAVYALCGPYTTPPAQPEQEQEPVATANKLSGLNARANFLIANIKESIEFIDHNGAFATLDMLRKEIIDPLTDIGIGVCYATTPPAAQRPWVGLTAHEYAELAEEYGPFPINQIEAKLKEKNT